jgi:hypothetical protein
VLYLRLIFLSVKGDVPVNSDALLMTDFVNLKIKPTQSFGCANRSRICVRVFIGGEYLYVYEYLRLYCVSKKRIFRAEYPDKFVKLGTFFISKYLLFFIFILILIIHFIKKIKL